MRKILFTLIFLVTFFVSTSEALAIYSPSYVKNNKVGIHIFSEKDLDDAARLVNNNGDWGYVTLVITEGERDKDRWQQVFDKMRKLHLIPIVRIATKAEGNNWIKPKEEEINNWVSFLNSLNWVIQNRYVIISNEPNHAVEWGGELKPDEYATYFKKFSQSLKSVSGDFFVLPAALDASATGKNGTMEQQKYIKEMLKKEPTLFENIDGWNSHSYPNPDFSAKETDTGQKSVAGFEWELNFLRSLGINKDLPVFITETGWSNEKISDEKIADKFVWSYQNVWNKKHVIAVTPFILNYPAEPFDKFSWKTKEGNFLPPYEKVKDMQKEKGEPVQIVKGDIVSEFSPPIIFSGSELAGAILAKNTGQTVWKPQEINLISETEGFSVKEYSFSEVEPMRIGLIFFRLGAPTQAGQHTARLYLKGPREQKVGDDLAINVLVVKLAQQKLLTPLENLFNLIQNALPKIR